MSKRISNLKKQIEAAAIIRRPTIAFGLKEPDKKIFKSLVRAKKYAKILLVGPNIIKNIKGFDVMVVDNPEEKIASLLATSQVEGIIRGTLDDFKTYEVYQKITGSKSEFNPALIEDLLGHEFFLSPASNPEGWEKEERLAIAEKTAKFATGIGVKPVIAIFAAERHETYPRKKHIKRGVTGFLNKTYEDAEWITAKLKMQGFQTKNWAIDLNPAIEAGCNILIPVNGMVGNQIFRALYVSGGKVLACPRLGLPHCYEDNSRTEKDFEFHVKWLAAWINNNRNGR